MITTEAVLGALSGVRDPELDQPLTELGFVEGVEIDRDTVSVRLRLPTYFCAANFAFLMTADAKAALLSLPGVREARIVLDDHFASEEINAGVSEDRPFQETFPGEAEAGLDDLRRLFRGKALIARQEKLCAALLKEGHTPERLAAMRVRDLPASPEVDTYLDRRRELGVDVSADAPLLVDAGGRAIQGEAVKEHLRFARMVRLNIEGNAGLCRALLAARYGIPDPEEATP